jgi:hypothetical protein
LGITVLLSNKNKKALLKKGDNQTNKISLGLIKDTYFKKSQTYQTQVQWETPGHRS